MSMSELADKAVNEQGASAELDTLIHAAINGWPVEWRGDALVRLTDFYPIGTLDPSMGRRSFCGHIGAPPYTRSIDAAMTLVPTNPFPELRPGTWWWSVDSLGCDAHVAYENHDSGIPEYHATAATPALALTAAALRARGEIA